jgi:hypothetical protein
VSSSNCIALGTEILCQVSFHNLGCFEGHGIVHLVKFREEANPIELNRARSFNTVLMVLKTFGGSKTAHTYVKTRFQGIPPGVCGTNFG